MSNGQNRVLAEDFFIYTLTFSALANGASAVQNLSIQADSDFVLQKLSFQADIAAATQTDSSRVVPLVSAVITDSGSGRQFSNSAVSIPTLFGTGEFPFILPQPKRFAARSTINVNLSNYSNATTYNIYLSFIGKKVFLS